jgi:hypothetical protein
MALDILLGRLSPSYARGASGQASEAVSLFALLSLALAPLASRAIESSLYRSTYRRGSLPTREVPVVPMREMLRTMSQESPDLHYSPRMYGGDIRQTRELPVVDVAEQVDRVYGRRYG